MASIFTRIIQGEIPCYKIMEDDLTLSFLTIQPIQLGHTLVVPKVEVDHYLDVPQEYLDQVFRNSVTIGKALQKATDCRRVGTMIQGWEVPHFHYHVVPMFDPSDLSFSKAKERPKEKMENIQKKILQHLE